MKQQTLQVDALPARDLAYAWLEQQFSLLEPSRYGLNRTLDWLIAAWICEHGFGLKGSAVTKSLSGTGAREVAQRIDSSEPRQAFGDLFNCDPLRVALSYGIIKQCEISCTVLEEFMRGLAESLANYAEEADPDHVHLLDTRLLLSVQGLGPPPR